MKLLVIMLFLVSTPLTFANEKNCYVEDSNCREEKVNCREEPTDCKEKCLQERCFDFVDEKRKCMCVKKEKTDCKNVKTVCDTERICDEKLVCEEIKK